MQSNDPNLKTDVRDGLVVCENSRGAEIQGTLLRLGPHEVTFEMYSAAEILQLSEVLSNVKIIVRDECLYSGRAVVASLINAGPVVVCQALLQDAWIEVDVLRLAQQPGRLPEAFRDLVRGWEKVYRIGPEYKVAIADIQSFLFELRHWVEEVELGLATANGDRRQLEREAADALVKPVTPCLNALFEKFEVTSGRVAPELQAAHGVYVKRQLHSLLLGAPFMHRIYRKPLGYAGDYEMVNMILRDPHEGGSLYSKVLNCWFLSQVPAEAHRNRVKYLARRLGEEALRHGGGGMRVLNLGCGPAQEVGLFMRESELSNRAEFTLLDFNEETLAYAKRTLEEARRAGNRTTRIQLVKRSVAQVLKAGMRNVAESYDVIYCAGLFDYLADRICQQIMNMFYEMLSPGGLLLVTNVDSSNPIRNIMGYIFEWRLIERSGAQMYGLAPAGSGREECAVTADSTGCNVFLEVRKPGGKG